RLRGPRAYGWRWWRRRGPRRLAPSVLTRVSLPVANGPGGRERSIWGWGWADAGPAREQQHGIAQALQARYGLAPREPIVPPEPARPDLPAAPCQAPPALAPLCSTLARERASHTYGRSFRDVLRGLRGDFANPPDVVAHPRTEADVEALLDWCAAIGAAAIPYGGGSSVVGGVEAPARDLHPAVVSLDLTALDQVVEVDRTSRAARIQAGVPGPSLEEQLRPHGLTLRHFPQSFEFSTLGGWI